MEPPRGEGAPRTASRSSRMLGLLAAVGFSIAMWVFIAVAVLGLVLKVIGPKGAEEGLAAAGISIPQIFKLENTEAAPEPAPDALATDSSGAITTLNGQVLIPADGKAPKPPEAAPAPSSH